MRIWINNVPLAATYDATSPTSKFFLGRIPALRVLPGLPVYVLRITARLPTIQDPFISDLVLYPANNLSHDVVLGQDWRRLLYQAGRDLLNEDEGESIAFVAGLLLSQRPRSHPSDHHQFSPIPSCNT